MRRNEDVEGFLKTLESYEFDYVLINKKGLSAIDFDDLIDRLTAFVGAPVGTISGYGIYVLQKSKTDDQANETTGLSAANDNHKVNNDLIQQ